MSSFEKLISTRRSTRKFTNQQLTPEQVETLLKAGLKAPSSKGTKCWQFVVVEGKEKLEKLSFCKKSSAQFIADSALSIIILADPLASDVWIEDASIAAILIQLQAEDLGLGSCWVQIRARYTTACTPSDEYVRDLCNIPLQMQVLCVIAIGHKAHTRSPFDEEKLQWEKIHIDNFKL